MPFPWARYWRRVGVIFVIALIASLLLTVVLNGGHVDAGTILVSTTDSVVLAVILAFPFTQRIYRGP